MTALSNETLTQPNKEGSSMEWSEFSFMVKPSRLGGVGVFAVHDIPAGTTVFRSDHNPRKLKINDIPEPFRQYCIYISDEECYGPERFDRMEIGWYINHSANPNIARKNAVSFNETIKNPTARTMHALRDIKAGDEILIDYNDLDEPEHIKEDYYKRKK
jgi:SET domain-containing protein